MKNRKRLLFLAETLLAIVLVGCFFMEHPINAEKYGLFLDLITLY